MEDDKNISPLAKFTHSIKSDGSEMLVIRTDSEEELIAIRNRLFPRIVFNTPTEESAKAETPAEPQKENSTGKKPYLQEGDGCHACNGKMSIKTATNRKSGKEFNFLGCSNYPNCEFTAYVKQQKKA